MNFFAKIKDFFMNRIDPDKLERTFNVKIASNLGMQDLIEGWLKIYQGRPYWIGDDKLQIKGGLNTASTIVSDLASKCLSELSIGTDLDKEVEDFWNSEVRDEIRQQLEYGLSSGAIVMRPYYDPSLNRVALSWYTADRFVPLDWVGNHCMSGIFIDQDEVHSETNRTKYYTKLECHKWHFGKNGDKGTIDISIKAFCSDSPNDITHKIALSEYPKWANIPSSAHIEDAESPLFVYARMPFSNNKALNSRAGVSIYKDGVALLEQIDRAWDSLNWEVESGQRKVFVDLQMLETERKVNGDIVPRLDDKDKRLFKVMDANGSVQKYMDIFSPEIRQADITSVIKTDLSLLCNVMHLDSGAYVYDEAKQAITAKEIKSKDQKTYLTICDIQNWCIRPAIQYLFEAVAEMQRTNSLNVFNFDNLAVSFGDSILIDEESDRENAQKEVSLHLRSKLNYLMEYRHLSEEEARKELQRIEEETPETIDFFNGAE